MLRLQNTIQRYAWGSTTALPSLLGTAPDGQPQAELWLGAHPSAPSQTEQGPLDQVIAKDPARLLGERSVQQFGPQLPFLFKVLAAGQPLSLQAHPSLGEAKAGFAREEAAGTKRSAANRNYRDANHKPEIICALTDFRALCGFRRAGDTARFFDGLGLPSGLTFQALMTMPKPAQDALVGKALLGARAGVAGFEQECALALQLAALYPGDVGIVGALFLNLLTLKPGEALYLGAGNLHAYLEGTGVELMANSDNVLRGGLTPKHVDVPELMSVLKFEDGPAVPLRPEGGAEAVYVTPAPDFRLSRVTVSGAPISLSPCGPQILLVTEGEVTASAGPSSRGSDRPGLLLKRGESLFIGADETDVTLSGRGVVFRATPGVT